MRGRRPKPSALKILQGNPGKRPLNDKEPRPVVPSGIPSCPDFLTGAARKEWNRISVELAASYILTTIDETALAAYCQTYAHWLEAEAQVKKFGAIIKAPGGFPMLNPHVTLAKSALQLMCRFLVEFGMTPSSRSRLRIEAPAKEEDPLDAFLKLGGGQQTKTVQ